MSSLLASIQKLEIKSIWIIAAVLLLLLTLNPALVSAKDGEPYSKCKAPQWIVKSKDIYYKKVKVGRVRMYECSNRYYFAQTTYLEGGARQAVATVERHSKPTYYQALQVGKHSATSKLVDVRSGKYVVFGSVTTTKYPTVNASILIEW